MLLGFGWAVIQASRLQLIGCEWEALDTINAQLDAADQALWHACRTWLNACEDPLLKWQFSERLNNHSGLLQFHTSRNHRTSALWGLAEFIASQSKGSYGVLYVYDDEDEGARQGRDYSLSFRTWRILDGALTEHDDPLFSPFTSAHAFGGTGGFGEIVR